MGVIVQVVLGLGPLVWDLWTFEKVCSASLGHLPLLWSLWSFERVCSMSLGRSLLLRNHWKRPGLASELGGSESTGTTKMGLTVLSGLMESTDLVPDYTQPASWVESFPSPCPTSPYPGVSLVPPVCPWRCPSCCTSAAAR